MVFCSSTVIDLNQHAETRLLNEETVDEMLAQKEQGLGWFKTGDYWGHDGGDPGCSTEMMFNPKTKIGLIDLRKRRCRIEAGERSSPGQG